MTDSEARAVIVEAFARALGRSPTAWEAQVAQALALGETSYGQGWKRSVESGRAAPEAMNSHNWGAIQAGLPPAVPGESFESRDTHRDGSSYGICFKIYPSDVAGAADMVRLLERLNVLKAARNDRATVEDISRAIIQSHYSEGRGATESEAVENHAAWLASRLARVAKSLGEPVLPQDSSGRGLKSGRWFALGLMATAGLIFRATLRRAA